MFFFFNDTATTEIYTLSLHDALPICAFFHGLKLWSGKSERRRPLHARCAIVVMNGSLAEPLSRLGAGAESRIVAQTGAPRQHAGSRPCKSANGERCLPVTAA